MRKIMEYTGCAISFLIIVLGVFGQASLGIAGIGLFLIMWSIIERSERM